MAWSDRIRIIFAGDDLTDEDAMKALKVGMMHWTMISKNNDNGDNLMTMMNDDHGLLI